MGKKAGPGIEHDLGAKLIEDICAAIKRNAELMLLAGLSRQAVANVILSVLAISLRQYAQASGDKTRGRDHFRAFGG
jgi:hypothetical protein